MKFINRFIQHFLGKKSINNIFWNFFSGLWLALLIIIVTPLYVSKLGLELYGILSLWMVLQALMNILDFGLGATIIKEFSHSSQSQNDIKNRLDLLRTTEILYWVISFIVLLFMLFFSIQFSESWLKFEINHNINLIKIMILMSLTLFFQFPNVLYLNGLIGLQDHKLMNLVQIVGNTIKFTGGYVVLIINVDLSLFFLIQIFVALLQTYMSRYFLWRKISINSLAKPSFNIGLIKKTLSFSVGMSLTSIGAVLLSNIDRIVISKLLSTSDLGRYGIAFTATGFLQLAIQPFYRSFFPRFSELHSRGEINKLKSEYFSSCELISILIISMGCICYLYANEIFALWMGNYDKSTIQVFRLLIIAISCSGLGWLPAAFQQSHGWTSLHVKMIFGSIIIGLPLIVFAIKTFGVVGGTVIWLIHGISEITLGLWLMHKKLLIGELFIWFKKVIIHPIVIALPITYLSAILKPANVSAFESFTWIIFTIIILLAIQFSIFYIKNHHSAKYSH